MHKDLVVLMVVVGVALESLLTEMIRIKVRVRVRVRGRGGVRVAQRGRRGERRPVRCWAAIGRNRRVRRKRVCCGCGAEARGGGRAYRPKRGVRHVPIVARGAVATEGDPELAAPGTAADARRAARAVECESHVGIRGEVFGAERERAQRDGSGARGRDRTLGQHAEVVTAADARRAERVVERVAERVAGRVVERRLAEGHSGAQV